MNPVSEATPPPAPVASATESAPESPALSADPGPRLMVTPSVTRRGFLRGAALTGGGLMAATLAACVPTSPNPAWTFGPIATEIPAGAPTPIPATPGPTVAASATPAAAGGIPPGWSSHDIDARNVVRRYVGNLAPAFKDIFGDATFAKLADILGAGDNYPELSAKPSFVQVPQLVLTDALAPLTPELDGEVKVFRMTIDKIDQMIDELKPPVAALGFNKQWPGPTIRVNQGDRVRVHFTNNMDETTGIHFHGVELGDFFQDGIPFVTQKPIIPGETFAYEFTAVSPGSLMYHSHHNATDQVGRGLLGAFIVDPKDDPLKADRDYVWISNDALGGFTINGHGFPAVVPVLAAVGETVRIRFMNEGMMMHPWHSHGYVMKIVARDGRPLGSAAFECDTLGVNPGERFDALITVDRPGIWAFHCHVLSHVESQSGMFGMVTTMIVVPKKEHVDAIVGMLLA